MDAKEFDYQKFIDKAHTEGTARETINGISVTLTHEDGGDAEYDGLYSITLIDAETKEWMFDTGDIHIDDLHSCLTEAVENGKKFEVLQGTQLNNYIQYTNDRYYDIDKNKEIE